MVQKGKFSAGIALLVKTLKKVDFPTLGSPTIPTFKFVPTRPSKTCFSTGASFFGGMIFSKYSLSSTATQLTNFSKQALWR